jgi:superfamily II DNA or RNA helicase
MNEATAAPGTFAIGSLIKARDREWVVTATEADFLLVRPLNGAVDEETGIYLPLEDPPVVPAVFSLPTPQHLGDHTSARLLREGVRLGFRNSCGPFRSIAQIAVEPRPYQLVPLIMALRLEPIRLLIADDVGVGKTIEACLIARELLDRGEVRRMCVLCPPHLAELWQVELRNKFHIDTELVLSSTVTRLERNCAFGQSLFEVYDRTVVSIDYIKTPRHREEFLRSCPELVIVDEAHGCALPGGGQRGSTGRQLRHQLMQHLAEDDRRHLILVTATPHSGDESAFRSLLTLLNRAFANLPEDLSGKENEKVRRELAQYLVQRRRGDLRQYLQTETPFPRRLPDEEVTYQLSGPYRDLFDSVLDYARGVVEGAMGEEKHKQRIRYWSMLALLRALASSPAAAAATLRSRSAVANTANDEEADEVGQRVVLDQEDGESAERIDAVPGSDPGETREDDDPIRRRLRGMANQADELRGDNDNKLKKAVNILTDLLKQGFNVILFCRFIDTANYVAEELPRRLPRNLRDTLVVAVTGTLPPEEREERVNGMADSPRRVLVCTDCLSEGVNLQQMFDAVVHYDLSWNPTRHEQREGRIDRFGQPSTEIKVVTYYGVDTQIDGVVLEVLLRKHEQIRRSLGVSVPMPGNTEQLIQAVMQGWLLRGKKKDEQRGLFDDILGDEEQTVLHNWDIAGEREKRSRTVFAQEALSNRIDEAVRQELAETRASIGSSADVAWFTRNALNALGGSAQVKNSVLHIDLAGMPKSLQDLLGDPGEFRACFELPAPKGVIHLERTHPFVEKLASHVLGAALDPHGQALACRAGVVATGRVERRTTLLVVRFRFHLLTRYGSEERPLLAEDCQVVGFRGAPDRAEWLPPAEAAALLQAPPEGTFLPDAARNFLQRVIDGFSHLRPHLEQAARQRGDELKAAHERVREAAARVRGMSYRVEPNLPPDVLGIYVYLPKD